MEDFGSLFAAFLSPHGGIRAPALEAAVRVNTSIVPGESDKDWSAVLGGDQLGQVIHQSFEGKSTLCRWFVSSPNPGIRSFGERASEWCTLFWVGTRAESGSKG